MELWKPVKNYEGFYEASNFGNIKSVDKIVICKDGRKYFQAGRILKQGSGKSYLNVNLSKNGNSKTKDVHRIIAETFCEGDNKLDVDHINGIKTDNNSNNLRFVTTSQNLRNQHIKIKGYVFVKRNLKKPYQGQASLNGKRIHLGMFESAELAKKAHSNFLLVNQNVK